MKSTRRPRRPRRPRRSAAQWQRLVRQQAASGRCASAFCEQYDLSYASFIQWRRRLRQGDAPVISGSTVVSEPPLPVESTPFIELSGHFFVFINQRCSQMEILSCLGVHLNITHVC